MAGSAEVKTAMALARVMRRPAGALLSTLDHMDRAFRALTAPPGLLVIDPMQSLSALLAASTGSRREQTSTRSASRAPDLPARNTARDTRSLAPDALRPTIVPAGIAAATRAGGGLVAETGPAAVRPPGMRAGDLAKLRDALRRDGPHPPERNVRDQDTTDLARTAISRTRRPLSAALPGEGGTPAIAEPNRIAQPRQVIGTDDARRAVNARAATVLADDKATTNDLGSPVASAPSFDRLVGVAPAERFVSSLAVPDIMSRRTHVDTILGRKPSRHVVRDDPASASSTQAHLPSPPRPIAPPRIPAAARPARATPRLDDTTTALSEAAWRAGIDQP